VRASVSARASRLPPRHARAGARRYGGTPREPQQVRHHHPTKPTSRRAARGDVEAARKRRRSTCNRVTATPSERALSSPRISTSSGGHAEKASAAHPASTTSAALGSPRREVAEQPEEHPCTCEEGASESISRRAPETRSSATPVARPRYGFHPERPRENAKTAPAGRAPASRRDEARRGDSEQHRRKRRPPSETPEWWIGERFLRST